MELFLDWIGNMPRLLSKNRSWKHIQIPANELKPGDLVFLKHKKSRRLITHVGMATGPEEIFHCSSGKKGAAIEKIDRIFTLYTQPNNVESMLSYVDPRTKTTPKNNILTT